MDHMANHTYAERVQCGYRLANLVPLLSRLREPGRYAGANGHIALTTGELGLFDPGQAEQQLAAAVAARHAGDAEHRLAFIHPLGGLSHGLNPYTDWSMSVLTRPPRHTYLFLGLDFYSVADLSQPKGWEAYLQDPFNDPDVFWHRLWAWIMNRTVDNGRKFPAWERYITASDASSFIRADGGAFVFHNLIPYLRPAYLGSTDNDWPIRELRKQAIMECIVEDLRTIGELVLGRTIVYCTSTVTVKALKRAGFAHDDIVCWGAHPSKIFHPSTLFPRGLYFTPVRTP
jgi:hypothetical protein